MRNFVKLTANTKQNQSGGLILATVTRRFNGAAWRVILNYHLKAKYDMENKTSIIKFGKHIFSLLLTTVLLFSCDTKERTQESIKWINSAKKPIKVYNHGMNGWNYNYDYTLVDSTGTIYYTGEINLTLPDTIQ